MPLLVIHDGTDRIDVLRRDLDLRARESIANVDLGELLIVAEQEVPVEVFDVSCMTDGDFVDGSEGLGRDVLELKVEGNGGLLAVFEEGKVHDLGLGVERDLDGLVVVLLLLRAEGTSSTEEGSLDGETVHELKDNLLVRARGEKMMNKVVNVGSSLDDIGRRNECVPPVQV